jgi:hypothetical protein
VGHEGKDMKRFWLGSVGLSLSLVIATAAAEEYTWRPATPQAPAAAATATPAPAGFAAAPPPVSLGRPVPVTAVPARRVGNTLIDPALAPASFQTPARPGLAPAVFRAQSDDAPPPSRLPPTQPIIERSAPFLPVAYSLGDAKSNGPDTEKDDRASSDSNGGGSNGNGNGDKATSRGVPVPPCPSLLWGATVLPGPVDPACPACINANGVPSGPDGGVIHAGGDCGCNGGGNCGGGTCDSSACCGDACCGNTCCSSGACCSSDCCWGDSCSCDCCCPAGPHLWATAEYLLWVVRGANFPALATTSSVPFDIRNATATGGVLGQAPTVVLFGGPQDSFLDSGGRFRAGYWFDDCQTWGIDAGGFFLGDHSLGGGTFSSAGFPVLSRPITDAVTGAASVENTTLPSLSSGTVRVATNSSLWGAELNYRQNLCCGCTYRIDMLAGVRYVNLSESLDVQENFTVLPTAPALFAGNPAEEAAVAKLVGSNITVADSFRTHNDFYGGQLGATYTQHFGNWVVDVRGTVGLGDTVQSVDINGVTNVQGGPLAGTRSGGLLALPNTNIGHYSRDRFAVLPELGLTLGYQVTDHVRVFVGYNVLYWSSVVRPGDQVNTTVNTHYVPSFQLVGAANRSATPVQPAFNFHDTSFWAQGGTAGVEIKY